MAILTPHPLRIQYALWILAGCCLLGTAWVAYFPASPTVATHSVHTGPPYLVRDSTGREGLLTYQSLTRIQRQGDMLHIGLTRFPILTDSVGSNRYWVLDTVPQWQPMLGQLLSVPGSATSLSQEWEAARPKWLAYVKAETDSLSRNPAWRKRTPDQQLIHGLLVKLAREPQQVLFVSQQTPLSLPGPTSLSVAKADTLQLLLSTTQTTPTPNGVLWLFLLVGLATVGGGIMLTYMEWRSKNSSLNNSGPETDLSAPTNEVTTAHPVAIAEELSSHPYSTIDVAELPFIPSSETGVSEPESVPSMVNPVGQLAESMVLQDYFNRFNERYGAFYSFLQSIAVQPTDDEKQKARRWLVEMGLHAHSLARAYKLDPTLNQLDEEPNVELIIKSGLVKSLPQTAYRVFTNDPYEFDKRYQFVRLVLQEMDLGELEGVLTQKVYIAPPHLKLH